MNSQKMNRITSLIRILCATISLILATGLLYIIFVYISQNVENHAIRRTFELAETKPPILPDIHIPSEASGSTNGILAETSSEETKISAKEIAISQEESTAIYMRQPFKSYNHGGLLNANPDYTAWIDIPGTAISYPVVQSKDNIEYLTTSFEGKQKSSGSIFIDANIRNFKTTKNLVIHGHNMKSGSMFGTLASYGNVNHYNLHPFIYIYTPDETMVYQVVSAYIMPHDMNEELVYQDIFTSTDEYKTFMDRLLSRSAIQTSSPISYDKNILTLSTCVNHSASRFVVHAISFFNGGNHE